MSIVEQSGRRRSMTYGRAYGLRACLGVVQGARGDIASCRMKSALTYLSYIRNTPRRLRTLKKIRIMDHLLLFFFSKSSVLGTSPIKLICLLKRLSANLPAGPITLCKVFTEDFTRYKTVEFSFFAVSDRPFNYVGRELLCQTFSLSSPHAERRHFSFTARLD